jgi:peptidoglycan hydrolase CwlO-like protein
MNPLKLVKRVSSKSSPSSPSGSPSSNKSSTIYSSTIRAPTGGKPSRTVDECVEAVPLDKSPSSLPALPPKTPTTTTGSHVAHAHTPSQEEFQSLQDKLKTVEAEKRKLQDTVTKKDIDIEGLQENLDDARKDLSEKDKKLDKLQRDLDKERKSTEQSQDKLYRLEIVAPFAEETKKALLAATKTESDRVKLKKKKMLHDLIVAIQKDPALVDWTKLPYTLEELEGLKNSLAQVSSDRNEEGHPKHKLLDAGVFHQKFQDTMDFLSNNGASRTVKNELRKIKTKIHDSFRTDVDKRKRKKERKEAAAAAAAAAATGAAPAATGASDADSKTKPAGLFKPLSASRGSRSAAVTKKDTHSRQSSLSETLPSYQ